MENLLKITATPYTCFDDFNYLEERKKFIEYHSQNIGNLKKSTIKADELQRAKDHYKESKAIYDASDCSKNTDRSKCINLNARIESARASIIKYNAIQNQKQVNSINVNLEKYLKEFKDLDCAKTITEFRTNVGQGITDEFKEIDKKRIEEENKYQIKKRIFFGGIILLSSLILILSFNKKK